jgi:hypothetical protein
MKSRILHLTLGVILLEGLIIGCAGLPTAEPTPIPSPSATTSAMQTLQPPPTSTSTALPVTATLLPPTKTLTRIQTLTRTRVPATPISTFTRAPIPAPEWDARLDALGIKLIVATVPGGLPYWRLTKAEFWDEKERQGKHHIFVNALDERGVRIIGQKVIIEWPNDKLVIVTEDKPAPEYSANFPLDIFHYPPWGTLGAFTASIDGLPSDKVAGMGLPPKNIFVVFLLTFQRTQR